MPDNIAIKYKTSECAEPVTEKFDFLVVACDPRELKLNGLTDLEKEVNEELISYTFLTSLYSATRPKDAEKMPARYAVRFNPEVLSDMNGSPYGFRDEVFAHDEEQKADPSGKTWTTVYQLENKSLIERSERIDAVKAELDGTREAVLKSCKKANQWWDWTPTEGTEKSQPEEQVLVDYFPHFSQEKLQEGLPWKIRDAQGEKNTIYVSSFSSFESVLHCFLYGKMIMAEDGPVMTRGNYPGKDARFAVVGAGPSGLLFASQHLVANGYNNFKVFEKRDEIGGKTRTFWRKAPTSEKLIPCELGTCYLSPAYKPMFGLFKQYDAGEIMGLDRGSSEFRSIIDGSVPTGDPVDKIDGIEYTKWTVLKNKVGAMKGLSVAEIGRRMLMQSVMFCFLHAVVMKMTLNDPIPKNPPNCLEEEDEEEEEPKGLLALIKELLRLVAKCKDKEDDSAGLFMEKKPDNEIGILEMCDTLQEEEIVDMASVKEMIKQYVPGGETFEQVDGEEVFARKFSIETLKAAVKDVYYLTFGQFLDRYGLGMLKGIFVYGYQVQGYGTIETIPAYYGLVWITPMTMKTKVLGTLDAQAKLKAKQALDQAKKESDAANGPGDEQAQQKEAEVAEERESDLGGGQVGTVNIVTKGWGTLWDKIEEKDLQGKIALGVDILEIERHC